MKKTIMAVALLTAVNGVMAEDGIKSSVELGVIIASGNTETQSLNGKANIEHTAGKFRNSAALEALNVRGDVNGETTRLSEKYVGSGKSAYQFGKHSYAYLTGTGEHDPFSGYAYQVTASAGYGYRVYGTETSTLDLEIGPGYRQTRLRGVDEEESDGIARLALKGAWKLTKTATLTEDLVTEGADYWITKSVTGLATKIDTSLSMKVTLTIKNNSDDLPAGVDATDTETAITLVYSL